MQSDDTLRKRLADAKVASGAYSQEATVAALEKVLTVYINEVTRHFTEVIGRELSIRLVEDLSYPLTSKEGKRVWAKKLAVKVEVKR